ncbi:prefoldin subunit alpha [Candidatus Woesearchaeota archaeon]|nr:prefoldin subunit alpha [Candidatus Woesearchaeota archaeon]
MKEEIQKKYIELQLLNQQIKQIQEQYMLMQRQLNELAALQNNLMEIKDSNKEPEMFSSLGSGVYVASRLLDNKNVLVNVGNGVLVEKELSEAGNLIKTQMEELTKTMEKVREQLIKASVHNEELANEVNEMIQKEQNKK